MKALSVQPNEETAHNLSALLSSAGHEILTIPTGHECLEEARRIPYDLLLIDVSLPDVAAPLLVGHLRNEHVRSPIMIVAGGIHQPLLSAECFDAGADGYIDLPVHQQELIAHLHAVVRRTRYHPPIVIGNLEVDTHLKIVRVSGVPVVLTGYEYEALVTLARSSTHVVDRDLLMRRKATELVDVSNSIDVIVMRLRKKLCKEEGLSFVIETIPEKGYWLHEI